MQQEHCAPRFFSDDITVRKGVSEFNAAFWTFWFHFEELFEDCYAVFTAALALRSRGLVIGSREEKEREEKEEEEKNLQIAFV